MPYPFSDTDPLTAFEDLINQVVEAANARTQRGLGSLATAGTGTPTAPVSNSERVNFKTAFPPGSSVIVTPSVSSSQPANRFASATAVDEAGFTMNVSSTSGANQTVFYRWTAGLES